MCIKAQKSTNISQLLHEMAYFRSGLRGAALLLRSGPKIKAQQLLQTRGLICSKKKPNVFNSWRQANRGIFDSKKKGKPKGYFSTSFFAMSVDGMYQGCIMRNMRTWEASFIVPDSSKRKEQEGRRTVCHLRRIYSTKSVSFLWILADFIWNESIYMRSEDWPKAWMHASSSSSTVADCSSGTGSIVPPSLPSLLTGCLGLKERKGKGQTH